jgi:hypothetical protein
MWYLSLLVFLWSVPSIVGTTRLHLYCGYLVYSTRSHMAIFRQLGVQHRELIRICAILPRKPQEWLGSARPLNDTKTGFSQAPYLKVAEDCIRDD